MGHVEIGVDDGDGDPIPAVMFPYIIDPADIVEVFLISHQGFIARIAGIIQCLLAGGLFFRRRGLRFGSDRGGL